MASKVYKLSEWQSPSGIWHVAHIDNMRFNRWWILPQALGISYEDYILMLKEQYHASHFSFCIFEDARNSYLGFGFDVYKDAHQYLLDMNKILRKKGWAI